MFKIQEHSFIEFDYVNYEGKFGHRNARVIGIYYDSTEFHPEKQWLMKAWDMDKQAERTFAMKDMSNVNHLR